MNSQRNLLFIAFLLVSFMLFQAWEKDHYIPPVSVQTTSAQGSTQGNGANNGSSTANHTAGNSDVPENQNTVTNSTVNATPNDTANSNTQNQITVNTDVLRLTINTVGGDITDALLLKYPKELHSTDQYFQLLQQDATHTYIAQSGLIGANGIDTAKGRAVLKAQQKTYQLTEGQTELRVPLTIEKDGVTYTKTFILKPDSYAVDVEYLVDNKTSAPVTVEMYAQLKQTILENSGSIVMPTYRGGAYSDDSNKYQKYSFSDMEKGKYKDQLYCLDCAYITPPQKYYTDNAWVGMLQHYFAAAWIPRSSHNFLYTAADKQTNQARIGVQLNPITVAAGQQGSTKATLWVGPKLQSAMAKVEPHLELSVDYGWLWFIAKPIHQFLVFIHSIVGNWGVAIILLTFCIRGAMYPLTKKQYTSMAKMRILQPQLKALQERLGEDKQRLSQEMMALYKKEKVNPLGGCLPLVIQMPIFISLYYALMESVELRHAPFFFWLQDLAAKDPYYILPVCMGASMFLIQKMSPTTVSDPMQQKIMTFMPIIFSFFFLQFPAGLVLYYLMSNIVTVVQQTLIYKALEKKGLHAKGS